MKTPNGSECHRRASLPPYYVIKRVFEGHPFIPKYPAYYVFRVYGPDDRELEEDLYLPPGEFRGYYATRLSHFIRPNCADGEIEKLLGKLLDEGQFKELMVNHIRKCFKSRRAVNSRLEKLESFVSMKLGRMRLPAFIKYARKNGLGEYSYLFSSKVSCVYQHFTRISVLWMLKDGFCLPTYYIGREGFMACFPYDPEDVDVDAVAKMSKHDSEISLYLDTVILARSRIHEWWCTYCKECQDACFREWVENRLEKAEQTLRHVLFLLEMLG